MRLYHSEKLFNAFFGDSIPIYFGGASGSVFEIFNKDAFIWWDPKHPQPALLQLMELDRDPVAYKAMQEAPMFANGSSPPDACVCVFVCDVCLKL